MQCREYSRSFLQIAQRCFHRLRHLCLFRGEEWPLLPSTLPGADPRTPPPPRQGHRLADNSGMEAGV
ncbi:hypothetical protein E2C01_099004 [Portunus trituberculatus]|uniref:Uncharacterized protein n=1 Tax=Portunus trituberculatus TaxID=210409 RepID=A0A5B7KDQ6_PORTR|nr:hypothetical protein [Portunus trituberculatus]